VPLTLRLAAALKQHRHVRGLRVLYQDDGAVFTEKRVQTFIQRAARRVNLRNTGAHILRHSFCSHLAMRGAPVTAIQELAGHKDLKMTMRYMHLSPGSLAGAIRLLDQAVPAGNFGDILETERRAEEKGNV
jgi:site-specific recombinase XerD